MHKFTSRSEGLRIRQTMVLCKPQFKGKKKTDISAQSGRRGKFFLPLPFFVFFQAFDRWDDAHPHWGGSSVFLNLLIQMLICFGNTLTDILRNNVQPNIWAFHGPVKLRDSTFALAQTLPRWSPPDTYPQKTLDKIPSKDLI